MIKEDLSINWDTLKTYICLKTHGVMENTTMIAVENAYISSLVVTMVTLFMLGIYLGKIAKENVLIYGIQTLLAGIATVAIALMLGAI